MILDDTFVRNVERLEECVDRGDLDGAENVCRSALDASKNSVTRAEWLRRHAEVLVGFGCFARGKQMARRAIDEISKASPTWTAQCKAQSISLDSQHLSLVHGFVDPPLATDLARESVILAKRLLDSPSLDRSLRLDVWVSLANAYGVLGMPEERLRCHLSAAALGSEKEKQTLVWLGVADATNETDGFEASYQVIADHVLPVLMELPELAPIVFVQIGDLFLDNEHWTSACKAYEAARAGLKHDPIRRQNRPFVADLHFTN